MKLTRRYWDQSALLQGEWDVPILGRYEGLPLRSQVDEGEAKTGVILLDWDNFLANTKYSRSQNGFAVLL